MDTLRRRDQETFEHIKMVYGTVVMQRILKLKIARIA